MAENVSSNEGSDCVKSELMEEMFTDNSECEHSNNSARAHMGISAFIKSNAASDVIIHSYKEGRHFICCKACTSYPDLVKQYSYKRRLPPIATIKGTIFRRETLTNHLKTIGHIEASKVFKQSSVQETVPQAIPLEDLVSKDNEALANRIGGLMLMLYNDAKQLTLSKSNWSAQAVIGHRAMNFQIRGKSNDPEPEVHFPHVLPDDHRELLECIVEAYSEVLSAKLQKASAVALHCHGLIDANHIDKMFVTCKLFLPDGTQDHVFLGVAEPEDRGAKGVFQAVRECISYNLAEDAITTLSDSLTAIITDGTNIPVSERLQLWDLMVEELNSIRRKPCLKVWCALHRSQLVWQAVGSSVAEVTNIFQRLVHLCSYFHVSGVRTQELRKMAKLLKLELFPLPIVRYDGRWTDFSYSLLNAVLISWHPLVSYLKQASKADKVAKDHLNFLRDLDQLELLTFLADLASVHQRFQKGLTKDHASVLDVGSSVEAMCATVQVLKTQPLAGGWQNAIQEMLQEDADGEVHLKGLQLRCQQHQDIRDINVVQCEITNSFLKFLQNGFAIDNSFEPEVIKSFVKFDDADTDIKAVHQMLVPEMELHELSSQFEELCQNPSLKELSLDQLVKHLTDDHHSSVVQTALLRLQALKFQSCDLDCILNSNAILTDSGLKAPSMATENAWLFIHHNMPPVAEWDPKLAVLTWFRRQQQNNILLLQNNGLEMALERQATERQIKKPRHA